MTEANETVTSTQEKHEEPTPAHNSAPEAGNTVATLQPKDVAEAAQEKPEAGKAPAEKDAAPVTKAKIASTDLRKILAEEPKEHGSRL